MRTTKHLTLDWDARTIRVVAARTRGPAVEILKAASIPIPPDFRAAEAPAFGRFLRDVLDQAGISFRHAVIAVPRDKVVLNTLSLPPTSDDDLPALVQFQMAKELPFAPGEATLDFAVRDADPAKPRDILVAAARNDLLKYYQDVADEAGLSLDRLGLRPEANLLAFSAGAPDVATGHTLLVDIGPDLTEIDILSDGRLTFSRAASVRLPNELIDHAAGTARLDDSRILTQGVVDLAAPDNSFVQEAIDLLQLEVTRSVEAFRATAVGVRFDRAIIAGATGVETAFAEVLSQRLSIPVELYNPGRALDLTQARARELRGFSAAIGLAMGHARTPLERIDFLEYKRPVSRRTRTMQRVRVAVAAVLILAVLAWKLVDNALAEPRKELAGLKSAMVTLSKKKSDLSTLERQVVEMEKWIDSNRILLDDLVTLSNTFPSNKEIYAQYIQIAPGELVPIDILLRTKSQDITIGLVRRLCEIYDYNATLTGSAEQQQTDPFNFTDRLVIKFRPPKNGKTAKPPLPPATQPAQTDAVSSDEKGGA